MAPINLKNAKDFELMNLLGSNDLGAWTELVNRYSTLVYAIAFQILKNVNDTEDAVQNTFVNLKIYGNKFDKTQELKPWLARIASVEAIRIYNKKKYINKKESVRMATKNTSQQSQRREASEIVEQKEIESLVKKAIDLLPEPTRVAVTLYYAGEMNQTDIAKELDVSQDVISRKIKAGLEAIKNYLKNAGVHASIALSPSLVQESLSYTRPSQDFIQKLTNHLPTTEEIARASAKSMRRKAAIANSKVGGLWPWVLIGVVAVSMVVFLLIPQKENKASKAEPLKPMPVLPQVAQKPEVKFLPIDFKNYTPVYFKMGKVQAVNNSEQATSGPIIHIGGEPNWSIQDNNIKRKVYQSGTMDGLYINMKFSQACLFRGTITIDSENDRTGFLMLTPLKAKEEHQSVIGKENATYNVNDRNGQLGDFNTINKSEIEFNIYVWPEQNTWKSVSFFKFNGKTGEDQFMVNSLEFSSKVFQIGVYSTGRTEFKNTQYKLLDAQWDPKSEPMIKEVIKDIPLEFFK